MTTYLGLSNCIVTRLADIPIKQSISGFYSTDFPLWRLGCLLGETWVDEDVLNGMSELLYFRVATMTGDTTFKYLPTSTFNDARRLYQSVPRQYNQNLIDFRLALDLIPVENIAFNLWHNDHYHAFFYNYTSNTLKHGDGQHSPPPPDILDIFKWIINDLPYIPPTHVDEDPVGLQSDVAYGSCAIVSHNFVEYRIRPDCPQWSAETSSAFRDQALMELLVYDYCSVLGGEVRVQFYQPSSPFSDH